MSIFEFSDIVDESNAEFIPLLSTEDEDKFNAEKFPETLSILPLRNTVLFPGVVLPITVGRDKSIKLINDANNSDKIIGVISQKDQKIEDPAAGQLNRIGTIAKILKLLKMPDGSTTVIIQGKRKFELLELTDIDPYFKGKIKEIKDTIASKTDKQFEAAIISIKDFAKKIIKISPEIPSEANVAINNIESASFLMNFISSNMNVSVQEKQLMLEQS